MKAFSFSGKCAGVAECADSSDELGCKCHKLEYTCDCITKRKCTRFEGCINVFTKIENGFIHCPNVRIPLENDPFRGLYRIDIQKLNNISQCDDIGFPRCDNSTCYQSNFASCIGGGCGISSQYVICSSYCSDQQYCHRKPAFQCNNDDLIFLDLFCDGIVDCLDGSDEIVNQPGFKCNECVLPQSNLFDDVAQCDDESDLCQNETVSCFQCFDKRLVISSSQVCDGVNDCFDMSDECLCELQIEGQSCASLLDTKQFSSCFENENIISLRNSLQIRVNPIQSSSSKFQPVTCQNKFGSTQAKLCDGRPECKDYSDECQCNNPPQFCNDSCRNYFPMGDRYCDGVEDTAWVYINKSMCPKGFDERWCPKRFKCNATGKLSIDVVQKCDGNSDCDDNSDEANCSGETDQALFSSDTEMIANPILRSTFWIIGLFVIFANTYVIIRTLLVIKHRRMSNGLRLQYAIILNISIADFLMGVYLLAIAAHSAIYSGIYGSVDYKWRSSLQCSIIGFLSIISTETSCFCMVLLTAFRLTNISKAMTSMTLSLLPWKLGLIAAWLLSFFIGIAPILDVSSSYFVHSISFNSRFFQSGTKSVSNLKRFMCSYAVLSNTTIHDFGSELKSIEMFIEDSFRDNAAFSRFGYYGETSVCLPRLYVASGDAAWEYTFSLITINFFCFLFISISYVWILKLSLKSPERSCNPKSEKQDAARLQKRITRIIATDFFCWIPICVMAYVRIAGVDFSNIVYEISAVFLLPINSALNPFLFSSLLEKIVNLCCSKRMNILAVKTV